MIGYCGGCGIWIGRDDPSEVVMTLDVSRPWHPDCLVYEKDRKRRLT